MEVLFLVYRGAFDEHDTFSGTENRLVTRAHADTGASRLNRAKDIIVGLGDELQVVPRICRVNEEGLAVWTDERRASVTSHIGKAFKHIAKRILEGG